MAPGWSTEIASGGDHVRDENYSFQADTNIETSLGLRVFDATGMEFLKNYLGEDYAGVLSTLEDRHAVVFGRASSCRDPVLTRLNDRDEFLGVFRGPVPAVREWEAQA